VQAQFNTSSPSHSTDIARQPWLDVAKGMGILLVVVGHALRGLQNVQLLAPTGWSHILDAWIYSFHMPLFFLLSGFFIERSVQKPLTKALKDRAKTILWPYLVWSLLQTLIQIRMANYTSSRTDWSSLLQILWKPVMQFWFLYVLMLLSVLWLGLRRCKLPTWTLLALAWLLHITFGESYGWAMWDLVRIHGAWFATGALLGASPQVSNRMKHSSPALRWVGIVIGFSITTLGAIFQTESLLQFNALWAVPGVLATLLLALSLDAKHSVARILSRLGVLSLEIFLVHTLASATVRALLLYGIKTQNVPIHLALAVLAGVLIPIVLVQISRRLNWRYLFRFGSLA
jgi:fucose 4-O-acetylase-like acetyltransferase